MKNYTVFYNGGKGYSNMAYSFKAEDDASALEFCKGYFSVCTEVMTIIENTDISLSCEHGRLVYNNGKFIDHKEEENTDVYYLLGRLVALVEVSNGKRMTHSQWANITNNPYLVVRYDLNKTKFMDLRQEIMQDLPSEGWPERPLRPEEECRMHLGYSHQKQALTPKLDVI